MTIARQVTVLVPRPGPDLLRDGMPFPDPAPAASLLAGLPERDRPLPPTPPSDTRALTNASDPANQPDPANQADPAKQPDGADRADRADRADAAKRRTSKRGRHRVPTRWGLRLVAIAIVLIGCGVAFGGGWSLGQHWRANDSATISERLSTMLAQARDWAIGMQ